MLVPGEGEKVVNRNSYNDEIDLSDLFRLLWRRRRLIVIVTGVAVVLTGIVSQYALQPVFESRTYIQLSEHSAPPYATPHAAAQVLTSLSFLAPIARANRIDLPPELLIKAVKAQPVRDTRIVYMRIQFHDRAMLRRFSDAVAREFLRRASAGVMQRRRIAYQRLAAAEAQLREVENNLHASRNLIAQFQDEPVGGRSGFDRALLLNALALSETTYMSLQSARQDLQTELVALELPMLVQAPYIPLRPVSPRPVLNAILIGALAVVITVIGALVADAIQAAPRRQWAPESRAVP